MSLCLGIHRDQGKVTSVVTGLRCASVGYACVHVLSVCAHDLKWVGWEHVWILHVSLLCMVASPCFVCLRMPLAACIPQMWGVSCCLQKGYFSMV